MNRLIKPIGALLCGMAIVSTGTAHAAQSRITKSSFGRTASGQNVDLYTLTNSNGAQAKITNYGGIVVSLMVPDQRGLMGDVVLGFDTLNEYVKSNPYFGALIGRFGNRIAKGRFTLNGKTYKLATNNGPNHLHGGAVGFDKKVWKALPVRRNNGVALELRLFSPNGEEGYPGNLNTRVLYTLTNRNELRIDYSAVSDQATVINLTHHTYFNLSGHGNGTILNHRLMINANRFTPTDATSIPTGELRSVAGTPFDFRRMTAIGARINANDQQIKFGQGYDHNYVINGRRGTLRLASRVEEPVSGRIMTVHTTEPGMQLYTGNFLSNVKGKGGKTYVRRGAFCLETQNFPDAPNKLNFPSSVLRPGQVYRQTTVYRFLTR
ncbi:MAG: aldose 1-epimerase [Abditibacteriota bacterium]|nr:aldose 1-epimerase [Abditibacteriota bacterium]